MEQTIARERFIGAVSEEQIPQQWVKIRPTPYGWVLVFLLVWVPLAGLGTANNFLLIIFLMILGLVMVSHRLAMRNLKVVRLSRRFPDEIFADTPFRVQYLVKSDQRSRGAYTLYFEEEPPLTASRAVEAFQSIPSGQTVQFWGSYMIAKRGDNTVNPGVLSSGFPFGLAVYSRACGPRESVLVFPRLEPIQSEVRPQWGSSGKGLERVDSFGTVPYHFREYVAGDPYKHIEWKKTAASGALVTKVFSDDSSREIKIRLPADASERALSRAASLVVHFARSRTPVALEGAGVSIEAGRGRRFAQKLLAVLARWEKCTGKHAGSPKSTGMIVEIDAAGVFNWKHSGARDGFRVRRS